MQLRALLFAPGDDARKTARALASEADGVILDLEDAVPPAGKAAARRAVGEALRQADRPGRIARVNPVGTPWYLDDLAAVVPARPDAVMLPKCVGPAMLAALDHHLEALESAAGLAVGGIAVLALASETTGARLDPPAYVGVTPRLAALCFGAEDLSADLGIAPRRPDGTYPAPVAAARAALLLAAGAAGVAALDTPYPDPRDAEGLACEAAAAAADGFAGKLCIHPAQLAPVQTAFTPSADALAWARRVMAAFAAAPEAGVLALDGRMIDRPHRRLAERILAAAGEPPPQ